MIEQIEIKLNDDEVLCDRCNGNGIEDNTEKNGYGLSVCKKCFGYKKLTWTEHIIGKRVAGYSGVTSTASFVNTTNFYNSGVLDPNGNIFSPYTSSVGIKVSSIGYNPKVSISSNNIEEVEKSE